MTPRFFCLKALGVSALLAGTAALPAQAQTIITTSNGIIRNSLCVGGDCQSGIPFDDSTIILKENNTRIKFADTSTLNSFPRNDWELEANSQTNGGPNRFTLWDCGENSNDGGCGAPENVLSVEAGAGNNAVYVDDGGRVGFGTGTPVVELHVRDGDTPTLRLEQDNSNGFDPQTWDVAGNEASFFIRDVTGGSALPFRIEPGTASNTLYLDNAERVGMGAGTSPDAPLEVRSTGANLGTGNALVKLSRTGGAAVLQFDANDNGTFWNMTANDADIVLSRSGTGGTEFALTSAGNLTITGTLVTGGGGACDPGPCDAVFDPAVYTVPSIEEHAALMWGQGFLPAVGPTRPGAPVNVTLKLTRMLNELEHAHIYIEQLNARVAQLEARLAAAE